LDQMIACCGLVCTKCPAFVATQKNDEDAKAKIAQAWSKHFKTKFDPQDINCDGCLPESGRRSGYCRKICEVRPCVKARKLKNCAYCDDYACEKLTKFFAIAHEAKETLDSIRNRS